MMRRRHPPHPRAIHPRLRTRSLRKASFLLRISTPSLSPDADVPEITVPAPWAISSTQTKVLRDSSNAQVVGANSTVTVNYVGVNGRTGAVFDSSFQRGKEATFSMGGVIAGFKNGLTGQKVGSRVLIGMTGADGYAQGNPQAGIQAGDSLVFVVDIIAASYDEATGEAVTPAAGLPTVTMTEGKPEVTFPEGGVNAEQLVVQPLIKGPGKAIEAESNISVKYRVWGRNPGNCIRGRLAGGPDRQALDPHQRLEDRPAGADRGIAGDARRAIRGLVPQRRAQQGTGGR